MKNLMLYFSLLAPICFNSIPAQADDPANLTSIVIKLSEGREVKKNFVQVNLLASVTGPDLARLNADLETSVSKYKDRPFKSSDTSIIFGNRNASVASPGVGTGSAGLFWTLQQSIVIQGLDQAEVLSIVQTPVAGIEISSINYSVPIDMQKKAESEVTELAIANVTARADIVRKSLGGKSVRIANINIAILNENPETKNQPPSNNATVSNSVAGEPSAPVISAVSGQNTPTQFSQPRPPTTVLVTADVTAEIVVSR